MYCPYCGSNVPDGVAFCGNCGSQLTAPQASNVASQAQQQAYSAMPPAQQYAQGIPQMQQQAQRMAGTVQTAKSATRSKPKKKGKGIKFAIIAVLVITIGVFAGIGLGLIPRFWENGSASGEGSGASDQSQYIDEKNGTKLKDLSGMSVNEAKQVLEDQEFELGEVITVYSYGIDSQGNVAYTDPVGGAKLKDDAKVNLYVIKPVDVRKAREYAINSFKMSTRIKEDPSYLEGTFTGEYADVDLTDDRHSYCDAWNKAPGAVTVVVDKVTPGSGNVDVSKIDNIVLHAHDNNAQSRHYNSADDYFSGTDIQIIDASNQVFTIREESNANNWYYDGVYYNGNVAIPTGEKDRDGKPVTKNLELAVGFRVNTDVDLNSEESLADLLGDNVTATYGTEEEAYEALAQALRDSSWIEIVVSERYNNSRERYEIYRLTKSE